MRGGKVFIKGDVGYRVGIHMKAYEDLRPIMVCGGKARDFFGEYMAGGLLILLGMNSRLEGPLVGGYLGTGMHGGAIYLRGEVEPWQCGKEVGVFSANEDDLAEHSSRCSLSTARRWGWISTRCSRSRSRSWFRSATGPTGSCTRTCSP